MLSERCDSGYGKEKAAEVAQKYVRGESSARATVDQMLKTAGMDITDMMAEDLPLDAIEQMDRLSMLAETRRNASLHELERHRAGLGASLRRNLEMVEEAEIIETPPAKNAA